MQLPWNIALRCIILNNDVHPNPGPPTFPVTTLNVGGPHLSNNRWNRLVQEVILDEPKIVALQEVRFKKASTPALSNCTCGARLCPHNVQTHNPDTIFLIHKLIAPYTKLLHSPNGTATAIEITLPAQPFFSVLKVHGPFSRQERNNIDPWMATVPDVGILMGDFNDRIWPVAQPNRWWQYKLLDGSLLDPGMSLSPPDTAAQPSLATRKGERLDTILFSPMQWHCTPPSSIHTRAYPSAGNHQGVTVLCVGDFGAASVARPPVIGSVRTWPKHKFQAFRRHMAHWSQRQPDLGTPFERHFRILDKVARFVESTPPPAQATDHIEESLSDAVIQNPTSARVSDWGAYMGKKQTAAAHKELQRFRKSAVFSTKTFFTETKLWGLTPFHSAQPQPSMQSACARLQHFAGDPSWDLAKASELLHQALSAQTRFKTEVPTWDGQRICSGTCICPYAPPGSHREYQRNGCSPLLL